MKNLTLITGGVRSGKSLLAEDLASKGKCPVYYFASMRIYEKDPEQLRRLELHRKRRPADWITVEAPSKAEQAIEALPDGKACVIFDCVSLYITNILVATIGGAEHDQAMENTGKEENDDPYRNEAKVKQAIENLLNSMEKAKDKEFIIVSNEVGWGVVPESALGRAFRDLLGLSNQRIAERAESVILTISGLPLKLK
ncbi:MAG: bifunctional adenosylcobinamide kinase/adenosylcobinamide-phosphate guanylyltransferase [Candidatus Obscuribacterales bacterium]|nr:bifunctional adenosylcobinamide kinase/adenosylcobinamide-phosphate guanylyltransferase [Candidatus Obscuribacterales bacterium]